MLKVNYLIHQLLPKVFPKDLCWAPFYLPFINSLDYDIQDTNFQFYADDTVMYYSAYSGQKALYKLQSAFVYKINVIQSRNYNLKLVLNADQNKCILFSSSKIFWK